MNPYTIFKLIMFSIVLLICIFQLTHLLVSCKIKEQITAKFTYLFLLLGIVATIFYYFSNSLGFDPNDDMCGNMAIGVFITFWFDYSQAVNIVFLFRLNKHKSVKLDEFILKAIIIIFPFLFIYYLTVLFAYCNDFILFDYVLTFIEEIIMLTLAVYCSLVAYSSITNLDKSSRNLIIRVVVVCVSIGINQLSNLIYTIYFFYIDITGDTSNSQTVFDILYVIFILACTMTVLAYWRTPRFCENVFLKGKDEVKSPDYQMLQTD